MKLGILIGRFQVPEPHEGHRFLVRQIQRECDEVLILFGSANRPRSVKNPYTYLERMRAMKQHFPRVSVAPLNDYKYSDAQWMADVAATITHMCVQIGLELDVPVDTIEPVLYGHHKDGNDYLHWFPQYQYVNINSDIDISGTEIRNTCKALLPQSVQQDMQYFAQEAIRFKDYPYAESLNFNCADPVLECNGHILVVQRGGLPGVGNWALPGGFKNHNETFQDCAIRELLEETNVRVPEKVLRGSIVASRLFDSPTRGFGIPRNTLAVHIVIKPNPDGSMPRVSAGDDAQAGSARWVPINVLLNEYRMHDDHSDIVSVMTRTNPVIAYANPTI